MEIHFGVQQVIVVFYEPYCSSLLVKIYIYKILYIYVCQQKRSL